MIQAQTHVQQLKSQGINKYAVIRVQRPVIKSATTPSINIIIEIVASPAFVTFRAVRSRRLDAAPGLAAEEGARAAGHRRAHRRRRHHRP